MSSYQNADELNKLTLGKTTQYISEYAPELLQAVPRSLNRNELAIAADNLPFNGEDVWYGYELSWLNSKGKPQVAVAEFRFCCRSENIVESKSFKLYLNSFNQTRFDDWSAVESALISDLGATANGKVEVSLYAVDDCQPLAIAPISARCIDDIDIEIDNYDFDVKHLASSQQTADVQSTATVPFEAHQIVSHLLKSNCLITNQPDWASVYIDYVGEKIDDAALLKYLISFRQHNEFHEQCVERIFSDLKQNFKLEKLSVFARYTRRGGLDINPYRSTEESKAPNLRTLRQ